MRWFSADVHGRADVFPAVNPVPGRPHDFRHVRPHGIKPRPGKFPPVSRAGNRNRCRFRLLPGGLDDFRGPVMIAQLFIFGIDRQAQKLFGAVLNTVKTAHAFEKKEIRILKRSDIVRFLSVPVVNAGFLYAIMAPGAVFPPVHDAVFADAREPWRNGRCFDMVFFWHILFLFF